MRSTEFEKPPSRRSGSREIASRFLFPSIDPPPSTPSTIRSLSPNRRRSVSDAPRKHRSTDETTTPIRALWPSSTSSSKKSNTLAHHLGNDRLTDLVEQNLHDDERSPAPPQFITRQRSCSEFDRFDEKDKIKSSKENRPIGGSMRYIGKLRFPRSSKPSSPASLTITPGRISVDENALAFRRKSDFAIDFPSSESDRSESKNLTPRIPRPESRSVEGHPIAKIMSSSSSSSAIKRSSSLSGYGSATTQWALSPGRRPRSPGSPPTVPKEGSSRRSKSFSSLRPPSPTKGKGVGNFISLGLDLFRRKSNLSGSSIDSSSSSSSSAVVSSFGVSSASGGVVVMGEIGHQFRLLHNRLIQWRYLNARSDGVNQTKLVHAEGTLLSAWASMSKLQYSVVQKQMHMRKEKLRLRLNGLLVSQIKPLEGWADMERQHASALSTTKDCLHAAVCRVPLIEGAKANPKLLSEGLRHATDLATTIKTTISVFSPMVHNTVPLLSELAEVVTREKALLEECFELMGLVYTLEIQEQSLKSHLVQLNSLKQQQQPEVRSTVMTN